MFSKKSAPDSIHDLKKEGFWHTFLFYLDTKGYGDYLEMYIHIENYKFDTLFKPDSEGEYPEMGKTLKSIVFFLFLFS